MKRKHRERGRGGRWGQKEKLLINILEVKSKKKTLLDPYKKKRKKCSLMGKMNSPQLPTCLDFTCFISFAFHWKVQLNFISRNFL